MFRSVLIYTLRWLRRLALLILWVVFASSVTLYLLARALNQTLSSPEEFVQISQSVQLPERSRPLLADFLVRTALQTGKQVAFLEAYPIEVWEGVAEIIMPVEWVEVNTYQVLWSSVNWLNSGQSGLPEIQIDLSPPLEVLYSPKGALAILPLMQNIPECPDGNTVIVLMGAGLASCLPKYDDLTKIAGMIARIVADALPVQISTSSLEALGAVTPETVKVIDRIRSSHQALLEFQVFCLRLSLLLLSAYCLLHSGSIRQLFRSIPGPIITTSILSFALIGLWWVFQRWGLDLFLTRGLPGIQVEALALISDLVRELSRTVVTYWAKLALYLLTIGLFLGLLALGVDQLVHSSVKKSKAALKPRTTIRKQFR